MDRAIEEDIKGLKCDATGCGYSDMTIDADNYHNYIDAPCPECGANLLTQADYEFVKVLMLITDVVNDAYKDVELEDEPIERFSIELDGSGIPKVGPLNPVKE